MKSGNYNTKLSNITLAKLVDSRQMSRNSDRSKSLNPDSKFKKKEIDSYKTVNINHQPTMSTSNFQRSLFN